MSVASRETSGSLKTCAIVQSDRIEEFISLKLGSLGGRDSAPYSLSTLNTFSGNNGCSLQVEHEISVIDVTDVTAKVSSRVGALKI